MTRRLWAGARRGLNYCGAGGSPLGRAALAARPHRRRRRRRRRPQPPRPLLPPFPPNHLTHGLAIARWIKLHPCPGGAMVHGRCAAGAAASRTRPPRPRQPPSASAAGGDSSWVHDLQASTGSHISGVLQLQSTPRQNPRPCRGGTVSPRKNRWRDLRSQISAPGTGCAAPNSPSPPRRSPRSRRPQRRRPRRPTPRASRALRSWFASLPSNRS